jgi:hypothetical protein
MDLTVIAGLTVLAVASVAWRNGCHGDHPKLKFK